MHKIPSQHMKRFTLPSSSMSTLSAVNRPVVHDLLWISKQQQQHSLLHARPLKNTIRVNSRGIRFKFDGKQWRPLCQSIDGCECRNLAFRSSLCQKHFYKAHLYKRTYAHKIFPSLKAQQIASASHKHSLSNEYERSSPQEEKQVRVQSKDVYHEDENSIEVIEYHGGLTSKPELVHSQSHHTYFSIDDDAQTAVYTSVKSEFEPMSYNGRMEDTVPSSESPNAASQIPKLAESIHPGTLTLTRTEEKSLANEIIARLPADVSLAVGEQTARQRVCEIIFDNYAQNVPLENISTDWFYDFLLRNPRVPINFQSWFFSVQSTLPNSDQLIDIKAWELGLITRSFLSSSLVSTSSP
ncbi:unnamed protein product [Adineta ricciae]|uniref:Uncharacterized protein n=1 Tax=Adineta ricciae TaxID=249248 RepID=A0A813ML63_ADIRI|nr:unnamed protein product [Adineta ricciae]CAF1257778.1 unnamed protein product [Adineta ricciae]